MIPGSCDANATVARTKTSRNRPVRRPKVATLFCAEALRASACVALDALCVRGWSVQLRTGDAAREALKRFRDPNVGIRVLCLPKPTDAASLEALRRALDPLGRGDLLIVDFFTPRSVVENILKFAGYRVGARRVRAGRRTTRSYLAQPTLIENTVDVGYWSRYGIGAAAAGVAILGGMSTFVALRGEIGSSAAPAVIAAPQAPPDPSALVDRSAFTATVPPPATAPPARPPSRTHAPALAPVEDSTEPAATLEEIELPLVPIEGLPAIERPRSSTPRILRGGAPGLHQGLPLRPLGPFARPPG